MEGSSILDMGARAEEDVVKKIKAWTKRRRKRPHSTLQKVLSSLLPSFLTRFVFSDIREFKVTKILLGTGAGGFIGVGFYFLLLHPLSIEDTTKIKLMYGLTGSFAFGWGFTPHFRCSTILAAINVLGKEGHAYLMIQVAASIYNGPIKNLEYNIGKIGESMSCTVELQINHTKKLWKVLITPLKTIVKDLVAVGKKLKNDSDVIKSDYKETKSEVESTEGYDKQLEKQMEEEEKAKKKNLTSQKIFSIKSMLRCEYVIQKGIDACRDWFDKKHDACMKVIFLPVLNSLLCLPLKFKAVCNIMYVVNTWCKNKLPIDDNFGVSYDTLSGTMNNMENGFDVKVSIVKDQYDVFVGMNISQQTVTQQIKDHLEDKTEKLKKVSMVFRVLLGCTFVFIFFSGYRYCIQYTSNIRFENYYVTTYFKQIDARRRKKKKSYLLPLRKGEYADFVFPFSPTIQGPETRSTIMEFLQCVPIIVFLVFSLVTDWILYHLFAIMSKHSYISYVFSSHHKFNVVVGGNSFLSNLLRRTIGAFNTSSGTVETSNNTECLPNMLRMTTSDYFWTCSPVVTLLVLCIVQVFVYRLRRVVAAYYFPKREKRRVLFLYNEYLRKRSAYFYIKRKQIMRKAKTKRLKVKSFTDVVHRYCKWLRPFVRRRCMVCHCEEDKDSHVCTNPECCTVYCRHCWRDMKRCCFACMPLEDFISDDSEEEYVDE
uniref:DC-STAMP domain-containing protein 1 n=1 Tax=Leptobrachium leishanense TaxID=445787 RepID=A0A8C5Q505_9ANUR